MLLISDIIANNLREIRKKRGLRQKEVAEIICVDESVYSRYENGVVMISGDKLYKLSLYFGLPIGVFYESKNNDFAVREDARRYGALLVVIEKISDQLKEYKEGQDFVKEKLNSLSKKLR